MNEEPKDPRAVVVAAALEHLLRSHTTAGALAWWTRPHPQLGGHRPVDLLDNQIEHPKIIDVAEGSRESGGS